MNAGQWLRELFVDRVVFLAVLITYAFGLFLGSLAVIVTTLSEGSPAGGFISINLVAFGLFVYALWRSRRGWSEYNLLTGHRSETAVGQSLEYALVPPGCAFAHSVKSIPGTRGDIDHLVLTPRALWVIETKSSRIPNERFRGALGALARNARAVRRWASPDIAVRAALVFGGPEPPGRVAPSYDSDGEAIACFERPRDLRLAIARELPEPSPEPPAVAQRLAPRVWGLGKVAPSERPSRARASRWRRAWRRLRR